MFICMYVINLYVHANEYIDPLITMQKQIKCACTCVCDACVRV